MIVKQIYNQNRRDCHVDFECEGCGYKETYTGGYDDRNFWDNIVPARKCKKCKKSSNDLNTRTKRIDTKYHHIQIV